MKVKIISKSFPVTDGMRNEAEERLSAINKFVSNDQQVKVSVKKTKTIFTLSVMLVYENKLIKVEKSGSDYYELLSELEDSLKTKLERLHSKKLKRIQDQENALQNVGYDHEADEKEAFDKIAKIKEVTLSEMLPEEAIEKMEELGHESYIFKNIESGKICMIYSRNDARYGMVEAN